MRRRQRRHAARRASPARALSARAARRLPGSTARGEAQVGERVLVAAVHARRVGQRRELRQRRPHLRGRALEQAAAARGEQRVAAEQRRRAAAPSPTIRDVPGRVARNVEHVERRGRCPGTSTRSPSRQRVRAAGNRLARGAEHGHRRVARAARDAADVVARGDAWRGSPSARAPSRRARRAPAPRRRDRRPRPVARRAAAQM